MGGQGGMTIGRARQVLSVSASATADEVRAAYRIAVKGAHPDHGGSEEALRMVLEAWRLLDGKEPQGPEPQNDAAPVHRLEITPVLAVVGGRLATRLPDGRRAAVTLPAGLRQGDRILVSGTRLTISIKGREGMFVSGDDLCMTVSASPEILRDGGNLKVKTPTGSRMVWVSKVGQNGIVRIAGQGLPRTGRHRQGALVLKLVPEDKRKDAASKSKRRRFAGLWASA